jgi:hypothetical protein
VIGFLSPVYGVQNPYSHFMPAPPDFPPDLLARSGTPEEAFGPNRRFRTASTLVGGLLVALGFAGFVYGLFRARAGAPDAGVYTLLFGLLMAPGVAAVVLPRRMPATWVFVCPNGLVRARGDHWQAVKWDRLVRFEDATLSSGAVTIRQCRVVLDDGNEWGFLADYVDRYRRLAELLDEKVNGPAPEAGAGPEAAAD